MSDKNFVNFCILNYAPYSPKILPKLTRLASKFSTLFLV